MAQERVVRREVHEETVAAPQTTEEVTRETRTVQTEQVAPAAPATGVTNLNVNSPASTVDPATGAAVSTGGQVSVNTPDGTQVNVNT
jgi:hypothetical protein